MKIEIKTGDFRCALAIVSMLPGFIIGTLLGAFIGVLFTGAVSLIIYYDLMSHGSHIPQVAAIIGAIVGAGVAPLLVGKWSKSE